MSERAGSLEEAIASSKAKGRKRSLAPVEPPAVDDPAAHLRAIGSRVLAPLRRRRYLAAADRAEALQKRMRDLSPQAIEDMRDRLRSVLVREGSASARLAEAMALTREVCHRTIGQEPFHNQLAGAFGLIDGAVIEMATGEGKTLTSVLAAAVQGLAGRAVHVVTSNDYLANRDAGHLRPALEALGLTVGVIQHGEPPDERRAAYACDVTFVSNKEVAFDFLRDRLLRDRATSGEAQDRMRRALAGSDTRAIPLLRALDVAIVDEIDSVLIDDAGTPLIISADKPAEAGDDVLRTALDLAAGLERRRHFVVEADGMSAFLTDKGQAEIDTLAGSLGGLWRARIRREELALEAVTARHVLERDRHYLVDDGKIVMVDASTGRRMPDRYWGQDLHRMLEMKEGLESSGARKSLASISFQRFFRRYRTLSGMSGTVAEVAGELARVYGTPLARIPRRLPSRLVRAPRRVHSDRAQLWADVTATVEALSGRGQPVLIGVRTVEEAARGSDALTAAGIAHRVLSAAQDAAEAEIVARAGEPGTVTIATNMAGRGTDIRLGSGVADLGGLVIMLCELHDSRRVDRQLMGRAGRQGDPGLVIELVTQEEARPGAGFRSRLLDASCRFGLARSVVPIALRLGQLRQQRLQARRRISLVRRDEQQARILAFAGGLD